MEVLKQTGRLMVNLDRLLNPSRAWLIGTISTSLLLFCCKLKSPEQPFTHFGKVYRIDSVANQGGLADPFFVVLTKDSLFATFSYWDYSYPYSTEFTIDDSLRVLSNGIYKYKIEFAKSGLWLNFSNGKRHLYSVAPGNYDSAYKHLRIMKTQESILFGKWKFVNQKSVAKDRGAGMDILRCKLDQTSILRFTRRNDHKTVQVETFEKNKLDTCLRRDFRLDGSAVLIFEYDGFPPWTILQLDSQNLIIQGPGDILYFEKIEDE
jgi:hypothetical protein